MENAAVFEDLSSSPAAREAGKFCDAYGLLPGHVLQASDAEQAYCQALLGGGSSALDRETWIRIPKHMWPDDWHNIEDPVVLLRLALDGHPEAGGWWERHCE